MIELRSGTRHDKADTVLAVEAHRIRRLAADSAAYGDDLPGAGGPGQDGNPDAVTGLNQCHSSMMPCGAVRAHSVVTPESDPSHGTPR